MEPVYALILCLDCEVLTGVRSVRCLTKEGTCATCGSKSILHVPPLDWRWREQAKPLSTP